MVVTVEGERSADGLTGTATRVVFEDEIEGPIEFLVPRVDETAFSIFGRSFVADPAAAGYAYVPVPDVPTRAILVKRDLIARDR